MTLQLHAFDTPNGRKITVALEEMGLPYRVVPVDIGAGDQFKPEFLEISPNNRMPALVDHAPEGGGDPVRIFESGAILLYLADKSGQFLPKDLRGRTSATQWLMWQMGGLGPMFGQDGHFKLYAPEKLPYAIDRYDRECRRLLGVMDGQLQATGDCLAGAYSIADMAVFPWIVTAKRRDIDLAAYPAVQSWFTRLRARPAVQRGMELLKGQRNNAAVDDPKAREILFGVRPTP